VADAGVIGADGQLGHVGDGPALRAGVDQRDVVAADLVGAVVAPGAEALGAVVGEHGLARAQEALLAGQGRHRLRAVGHRQRLGQLAQVVLPPARRGHGVGGAAEGQAQRQLLHPTQR
jgi:hypothetical protein